MAYTTTAKDAPAAQLEGSRLRGGWTVQGMIDRPRNATGGHFSCSYIVEHDDGDEAFLKALDYSQALKHSDPPRALQHLVTAYNFERDLLTACRDGRMSKVVTALDDGSVEVPGHGILSRVNYIIFEHADCDVREYMSRSRAFDHAFVLRALHSAAVALHQLHGRGIAHQDLKPSNLLVFPETQKVADLGRASVRGETGPIDELAIPGDLSYAPPELLYGQVASDWPERRQSADLYLLGSMIPFFFLDVSATALMFNSLPSDKLPSAWRGRYEDVLPYLRQAFAAGKSQLQRAMPSDVADRLLPLYSYLTDPDPQLRGHPSSRAGAGSPYELTRFVSGFDLVARRAELGMLDVVA